ncbi:tRNA 5-hydroxyuridine modification protein YegQ [Paucibacter sp. DJ2R-2]|uniref:prephenate-dependent tRNA uridine(34) hydroxylase TrhP n=1 Tax=Paucibacter sp. DJ2R-2 TaxID=2893558 RepID=UPI0021E3F846|nr:tRNA 5-hydroxyuridine modification protein YegQ [Paucibacter sp. DJ2R-2]MCV2421378.1 tRNA 5-hydroxyuridine modification protein YegQ [Paucibacter sp. DJ4R-1]MCV2441167.1 tRNA 5-hydroxyuridine modification protein YegQ [Paucibacter sp. DJ2R-2]
MTTPPLAAPELLLPAGDLERMRAAFDFGADAVYAGQPRYSLRARNNDFKLENLKTGIAEAHARGKKFLVASNILPHNGKLKNYLADMEPVVAMKPDALIMADPGLIMMVRERWPELPIHLSVQANTVNYAGVKFWQKQGLKRVILSRELSLDEVAQIRQECPDMELEVFVHGALCIAYSGRCLLSGYFNHRDANQGTCTNACRWDYQLGAAFEDEAGQAQPIQFDFHKAVQQADQDFAAAGGTARHPLADRTYLIEESQRPGELMPIQEDEHGTYIMNSKDLRAVEHVQRLVEIGVDSLKIEGRTKSRYYVSRAAQVYRRAIDDAVAGRPFDPALLGELDGLSNRGYTSGFYQRHRSQDLQNYLDGHSKARRSQFVGEVGPVAADGWAPIEVKNRFAVGDRLEIIHPSGNREITLQALRGREGEPVQAAAGNGVQVSLQLPAELQGALIARLLEPGEVA